MHAAAVQFNGSNGLLVQPYHCCQTVKGPQAY